MNDFKGIADFLFEVGHLAAIPRSGYSLLGTGPQNVAEHSFRVAWIGYLLARLDGTADSSHVLLMGMLHDLPETRTGDLHSLSKYYVQADASRALRDQLTPLPFGVELEELWSEYEAGMTRESRLAKDADQIELLLTLREQESRGQAKASEWLDRTVARIQTDLGRKIARAIIGGDPGHWWEFANGPAPPQEPQEDDSDSE